MSFFKHVYAIVQKIPHGRVATYGQIAALAGSPRSARMVGWALHQMKDKEIKKTPWHRVVNRKGRISTTCINHTAQEQAHLLKKEGIRVQYKDDNWFIDLDRYQWKPRKIPYV